MMAKVCGTHRDGDEQHHRDDNHTSGPWARVSKGAFDVLYDTLLDRVGHIDEKLNALKQLGILVDRDDEGYFAPDFLQAGGRSPDTFFRDYSTQRSEELRKRQFQSVVRSHRTRAGGERKFIVGMNEPPLTPHILSPHRGKGRGGIDPCQMPRCDSGVSGWPSPLKQEERGG